MTSIVWGDAIGHWVAAQTAGGYAEGSGVAIGLIRHGEIVAGCLFENFNGRSMVAHLAVNGRITPEFMWCLADYVFRQHGAFKLIAPIASTNTRMLALAFNMGFVEEAVIKDAAPDGDIALCTMTKEQCRFLNARYARDASLRRTVG